jgi:predicted nucleotide-binding protein
MKYNSDLALKILQFLEEPPNTVNYGDVIIDGYSEEEISYHIKKLSESGLVEGKNASTFGKTKWMATDLTVAGHKYIKEHLSELPKNHLLKVMPQDNSDARKVFVVHGRNWELRNALFSFLRSVGLEPIEWGEAIKMTGHGTPYPGDVLDKAFATAKAIVVLMTPDDEARLIEDYRGKNEPIFETELTPQPRQNVILEAGMALGRDSRRTILVEIGQLRPMSDILGRHMVRLDNTPEKRQDLIDRLEEAGCAVNIKGRRDWLTVGNFDINSQDNNQASLKPSNNVTSNLNLKSTSSSKLKIKKTFTDRERDDFENEAFEFITNYFKNTLQELENHNSHIEGKFRSVDANHFIATIYVNGSEASTCSIGITHDQMFDGITFSKGRTTTRSYNDALSVVDDGYALFLKPLGLFNMTSNENETYSFETAAEYYWNKFIEPLQR